MHQGASCRIVMVLWSARATSDSFVHSPSDLPGAAIPRVELFLLRAQARKLLRLRGKDVAIRGRAIDAWPMTCGWRVRLWGTAAIGLRAGQT